MRVLILSHAVIAATYFHFSIYLLYYSYTSSVSLFVFYFIFHDFFFLFSNHIYPYTGNLDPEIVPFSSLVADFHDSINGEIFPVFMSRTVFNCISRRKEQLLVLISSLRNEDIL